MEIRKRILGWIERDRDTIVAFLPDFIRAASPNPPGDTRLARAHIQRLLTDSGIAFEEVNAEDRIPNLLAAIDTGRQGPLADGIRRPSSPACAATAWSRRGSSTRR